MSNAELIAESRKHPRHRICEQLADSLEQSEAQIDELRAALKSAASESHIAWCAKGPIEQCQDGDCTRRAALARGEGKAERSANFEAAMDVAQLLAKIDEESKL